MNDKNTSAQANAFTAPLILPNRTPSPPVSKNKLLYICKAFSTNNTFIDRKLSIKIKLNTPLKMKKNLSNTLILLLSAIVSQAQWQPDVRLTNDPSTSNTSYNNTRCIASSGSIVHAVWYDGRDGNTEIYYKRSTDGGISWGADIRLTNFIAPSEYPTVSVSDSVVHVVWRDNRHGNMELYYKRSIDAGVTWSADIRLTNNSAVQWYPSLFSSKLDVCIVWQDARDLNDEIYCKRSADGGVTWGADTRLTNNTFDSQYPSIAISSSEVHVVWFENRDGNQEIYYKKSTDGGINWGADTRLTNNAGDSWYPTLSVNGSVVHVVWYDSRDGNDEIYYKRSTDGGLNWGPDVRLTNNTFNSFGPSISVSGSIVHIVWVDWLDGNREIYYKNSIDGGVTWGSNTRLTNNTAVSWYPSICVSGSVVHVMWYDNRDGNDEIYYKRNPTANTVGIAGFGSEGMPFTIFPNPANTEINVRSFGNINELSIIDIYGKKMYDRNVLNLTDALQIPIIDFPVGIYFIQVKSGNIINVQRFIKL